MNDTYATRYYKVAAELDAMRNQCAELAAALRNSLAFVEYVANNGNEGAHETAVEIRAALAKVQQ